MKLTDLLNPAVDEPMYGTMGSSMQGAYSTQGDECNSDRARGVLVVETQGGDSLAARNLMMLGTEDKPQSRETKAMHQEFARSPVVHPTYLSSFHMSPMALKGAIASPMWGGAMHIPIKPATSPRVDITMDEAPSSSPLKRRISSISSMLNAVGGLTPVDDTQTTQGVDSGDHCSVTGCLRRSSKHNLGKCAVHKGMKLCQIDGCFRPVQSRGCCKSHGGGARCKHPDCTKGAISKGRCRSHGGGTRCAVPECPKWAQRFGCCVRHSKAVNPKPPLL